MPLVAVLRSLARGSGVAVASIGAAVLIGWILDVALLKSLLPGLSTMKANTALAMLLAGASLSVLARSPVRALFAARGFAVGVALIGAATLGQYLTSHDLGIDELLFRDAPVALAASTPGRMGINTALAFLLLGLALLFLERRPDSGVFAAQLLALAGGAIGLAGLIGYLYDVAALYGIASYTHMALHTAIGFVLLSVGILLARSDAGLMAALTSDRPRGRMGRSFLPAALAVPIVLGWFGLYGHRTGLYERELGLSLLVTATMAIFGAMAWVTRPPSTGPMRSCVRAKPARRPRSRRRSTAS